jgi:hypothetical protein
MIDRQHGNLVYECDTCGETLETDTRDFDDARSQFRREGWHAQRNGSNHWEHRCGGCYDPEPSTKST